MVSASAKWVYIRIYHWDEENMKILKQNYTGFGEGAIRTLLNILSLWNKGHIDEQG